MILYAVFVVINLCNFCLSLHVVVIVFVDSIRYQLRICEYMNSSITRKIPVGQIGQWMESQSTLKRWSWAYIHFIHFRSLQPSMQCQWMSLIVSVHSNRYEARICELIKSLRTLPDSNEKWIDLLITKLKSFVMRIIGGIPHSDTAYSAWSRSAHLQYAFIHHPTPFVISYSIPLISIHSGYIHSVKYQFHFTLSIHRQTIVVVRVTVQRFIENRSLVQIIGFSTALLFFTLRFRFILRIHSQNWMVFIFLDFVSLQFHQI